MARDLDELVDAYMEQENLYRPEGRKGVEAVCQLAAALGYKDPTYFGQLTQKATIGDLLCMMEDNPGLVEAMVNWVRDSNSPEFKAALESQVAAAPVADDYENGICPDCGEDIPEDAVHGDSCVNCGHVFNPDEDVETAHYQPTDADFRCTRE